MRIHRRSATAEAGEIVRRARKQARLSQTQLGEIVGLNQWTISRIETGARSDLDASTIAAISAALKLNPAALITPFVDAPETGEAA